MPLQSKRISLTALGIDSVPGMESGNHLRIGFDPRMGFPPCGFVLYRRAHQTGPTSQLDFDRLFSERVSAPFRHGYLQDDVAVFHSDGPPPEQGPQSGVDLRNHVLGISFRRSPFMPDSNPKVCEVRLSVSSQGGVVTVSAFDDRYFNDSFRKILVDHQQRNFGLATSEQSFDLRADLISLVEIQASEAAELISFEYTAISEGRDWSRMTLTAEGPWENFERIPLLLPTPMFVNATKSTYPTCQTLVFPRDAEVIRKELPESRLKTGFIARTGDDDIHGEYDSLSTYLDVYLGPDPNHQRFKDLTESLLAVEAVPPAQQLGLTITNPGDADESLTFSPLPMILIGAVDYAFARLVGLAAVDMEEPPAGSTSTDYMVEAKWNNESHFWITHDVFRGRDKLLAEPKAPEATPVLDMTRPGTVKTNIQLDWHAPSGLALLDRANQYAGYHLFRRQAQTPGSEQRLTESKDELTGMAAPDLLLLGEVQGDEPVPPPLSDAGHFLDRPPAYKTFVYGLQAQDLFGRRSEISWGNEVLVPVLIDPPPVSDLFAFYVDTDDPGQAELDAHAAEILNATGQSDFTGTASLISFRYPKASIDAISGDVASFNVLYQHGRPNELLGILSTPAIVGPVPAQATAPVLADIELATATPVPVVVNGFGSERSRGALASHGEYFAVESATRLGTNLVRLRVRARRDYLPQIGEASLSIGRGGPGVSPHPAFVSPRDPAIWSGFDLRHPKGSSDQRPVRLSATDDSVLLPLPVAVTGSQLVVSRTVEPPANLPEGEVGIPSDWVYRIVVKDIELPLSAGLTEYPGAVTVQVISGANRRSELPAPAYVLCRAYGAPPPLTELATSEFVSATRPDFEGRVGAELTWPKIPGIQRFNVYRVEVPKLLQSRGANLQLAENLIENEINRAQVKLLGGQFASISSFTLVTPVAISPETNPEDPARYRWIDRIAAPRDQSYVYRIQPLSVLGDEAPWPPDSAIDNDNRNRCILVLQKNRDLLLPPAIYELESLDRSIGVVVRDPRSASVNGLRIYKTDQPPRVADVRSMTLIHGTIPLTHQRIEVLPAQDGMPARLRFVDGKVHVGVQYYYRVAFVDEFGNLSQASEPMAATPRSFSPPQPPTLFSERTATDTVNLAWQADHDEGQVKVQRKRSGEGQWLDVTPDWHLPTGTAVDTDAAGIVAHRLLLRDAKGRVVYSELVIKEA
jgi:hypothetical protein